MTDWSNLIAAMKIQSGESVPDRMSDNIAALLNERSDISILDVSLVLATSQPRLDFEPGLTDTEIEDIQTRFAFRFPPDLRAMLQTALPVGSGFPNWRENDEEQLREWLDAPIAGLCFDVEHNAFWDPQWGDRPSSLHDALEQCRALAATAPQLIPVYAHRYIPNEPMMSGNPVFSVHQTDIIYYGFDLEDYLRHEFALGDRKPWPDALRSIRFWDIDRWQNTR
jgi:hypothetical protein